MLTSMLAGAYILNMVRANSPAAVGNDLARPVPGTLKRSAWPCQPLAWRFPWPSPRPVFTTFDRSAMPNNLLTVAEWCTFARATKRSGWQSAARYYAERCSGALIMRANDALVVLTKLSDGRIRQRTYKPGTWGWAKA